VHNFIDGMIIGASYLISMPVGIATTIAVALHEIPQEIGDFGVLIRGGFSRRKALMFNFFSALTALLGLVIVFSFYEFLNQINMFIIPFAVGGFIYIAGADLIPELHKEVKIKNSLISLCCFLLGIGMMFSLLFLEI
jgi:zinc and cadmium transporter